MCIFCASAALSSAATFGNFSYTDDGTSITITDYPDNLSGPVSIPASINGKAVTSIGNFAFTRSGLESVTIPITVTSIGEQAFRDCDNLTKVTFLGNAPTMGARVFDGVVNGIDDDLNFYVSLGKTGFTLPSWQGYPTTLIFGDFYIADDGTSITITGYPRNLSGPVSIPASMEGKPVTSIGESAFSGCSAESVTIPSSVTSIGSGAFAYSRLKSMTIPNSVTSIEAYTFQECVSLESVTIPNSVTTIKREAFGYSGLWSVTIPNSVTSIQTWAFSGCDLRRVTIPSSVVSIGNGCFSECTYLEKATFLGNAPTMGSGVFDDAADSFKINFYDGKAGFTLPLWQNYPTAVIYDRPEITIQQPVGSNLVDGSAKKMFRSLRVGNKGSPETFTIKNSGAKALTGLSIKLDGLNAKDFIITQPSKYSLVAGASTTFKVSFKPTAKGTRNAAIHVKSNDSNESPFDIWLVGLGMK